MSSAPMSDQSSPMIADRLVTDAWQQIRGELWVLSGFVHYTIMLKCV